MADPNSANDLRYLPSSPAPRRSAPNVSSGWVVMLLSGLLAAVLFFYATQSTSHTYDVAAAAQHIDPGQPVTANSFRIVKVNVGKSELSRLVLYSDRQQFNGYIAGAGLEPGDIINKSSLRSPAASRGQRAMSIPVDKEHAVSGELQVGDRVDVVDEAIADQPQFVAQNLEVLSVVNTSGGGALTAATQFGVTVAVSGDQAVKVAGAIKGGKFEVIRSTGADPISPTTSTTAAPK
jgi:Flp pilus assembly protein CpaB